MSNSLFNAMTELATGSMQSANPFSLLAGMVNGGRSDAMLVSMAIGMLQKQNPQAAQQVQQMMSSGQSPEVAIKNATSKMNPQELAAVKQMLAQNGAPRDVLNQLG